MAKKRRKWFCGQQCSNRPVPSAPGCLDDESSKGNYISGKAPMTRGSGAHTVAVVPWLTSAGETTMKLKFAKLQADH